MALTDKEHFTQDMGQTKYTVECGELEVVVPVHRVTSGFIQGFCKLCDHFRGGNPGLHLINFSAVRLRIFGDSSLDPIVLALLTA